MAASLVILGLSTAIAGSFTFTAIMSYVVASGFIIAVFIVGAMAMFHPFNACLGPDERQVRTLNLALSTGSVSYTHLRAHETRHDLVCRLLLEKKKKKKKL